MPCNDLHCRLNDELLAILPWLETEQQQRILQHWRELDLATLSKLADYFQCGVYDVMRSLRGHW